MAIVTCERLGEQVAKALKCTYCNKLVCNSCLKSSKRANKVRRYNICKTCWGDMKSRRRYKMA